MNFLEKIFDNLEVKYGDQFNNDRTMTINVEPMRYNVKPRDLINGCTMTINVEPMKCDCDCDCSKAHDCCNDEKCCCHYEDIDDVDIDDYDEIIETPVTTIEMGNLDPIVAKNAVTASELRARFWDDEEDSEETREETREETSEETVKLINVNKNVSQALEIIYDVINEVADDGEDFVEFNLVEEFPELFKNLCEVTMDKVLARISRHLTENGFNVKTKSEVNEYDNKIEKSYCVEVDW